MNKIYHKEYVEQNYLENIYTLYLERDEVRNIDIVDKLGVARATVTHMLRNLEKRVTLNMVMIKLLDLHQREEL